ncbi:metal-dependent hydrolase [Halobium salinum]|uniref:Metal-dependent hydrolase n=1 Tax=Halobium salinum TaxID=1364940 RepID=A0ABD5P8S8_9EURY|nr:metal-dependent hydrolase [Halobium salinum]
MPSTVVHLAVAALLATALLGREFRPRTVAVVLLAVALVDADAFVGLYLPGAHRSLFHTLLLPLVLGVALLVDTRLRERSALRERWGSGAVRVAWVVAAAVLFAGIFPDLFTNGVNAFYPLHDRFYTVDGRLALSNQRGLVQSFVQGPPETVHTTENLHYRTGVDPSPGAESATVERVFPVVNGGWQLMLVIVGAVTLGVRLWETRGTRGTRAETADGRR